MADIFRRKLTRYILVDKWEEVRDGKQTRLVPRGKRVPKSTPGAVEYTTESKEWYAYIAGRRVKLAKTEDAAKRTYAKLLTQAEDHKYDRFAKHRQAPIAEHIAAYNEHLNANGRDAEYVRQTISRIKFVTTNCTRLEHLTADRVNACLNQIAGAGRGMLKKKKKGAGPTTRNTHLTSAKGFCKWCVRTQRLPDNPLEHLQKVNQNRDRRRIRRTIDRAEQDKLITTAEASTEVARELNGPDRAMLYKVVLNTGYRASEIASVSPLSLKLDQEPPLVVVEAEYSKRGQVEEQPIPRWLADQLRVWLAERSANEQPTEGDEPALLWPGSWRRHAAEMMRVDLAAAGISYYADGEVFDFHSLRHQYITNLVRAGVNPKVAQQLARHSTIELTMEHYTHIGLHDRTAAVELLTEPMVTTLQATGTDDTRPPGGGRVAVRVASNDHKPAKSRGRATNTKQPKKNEKPLQLQQLQGSNEAEGTRLELATGFPALHFQCSR